MAKSRPGVDPAFSVGASSSGDISLSPDTTPVHESPSSVFNHKAEPMSDMDRRLLASIPDMPSSGDMVSLESGSTARAPAPGFISDLPTHNGSFGRLQSDMDIISPPSAAATPASSNPSHVTSPVIHGITPPFSTGTSSLATALDTMAVTQARNRSASSASPPQWAGSGSEAAFSSPSSSHHPGPSRNPGPFFPQDEARSARNGGAEMGDPHLTALGGLLEKVINTAHSAKTLCFSGQGDKASQRISELKPITDLLQELMIATPFSPVRPSPPHLATSASPPSSSEYSGDDHHNTGLQYLGVGSSEMGSLDSLSADSGEKEKRKRTVSGQPADRIVKAPKLEPQDDVPLHKLPKPRPPPPVQTSNIFPSPPPLSASSNTDAHVMPPFAVSNPPSAPPTRPPSPGGLVTQGSFTQTLRHRSSQAQMGVTYPFTPQPGSAPPSASAFDGASSLTPTHPLPFPPAAGMRSAWSDTTLPTLQMQHPGPAPPVNGAVMDFNGVPPGTANVMPFASAATYANGVNDMVQQNPISGSVNIAPMNSVLRRGSRSGSINGNANPFAFNAIQESLKQDPYDFISQQSLSASRPSTSSRRNPESSPPDFSEDEEDSKDDGLARNRSNSASQDTVYGDRPSTSHGANGMGHYSHEGGDRIGHGNDVPQEYRVEVDRIFFEFLNRICSNLEATDAKGEVIHQTLMAKKMQRLDESPDFRPFKFRIQAFTNAFLEELARQGYPEEKIPMKKIRNYLWCNPYISRFNEDGKKAKSKGNHIWNIEAKKSPEGGWIFRPFQRRLAGTPPAVAYVGLRWQWTLRIFDPWGTRSNTPVQYSSPSLPSWLNWKGETLSGIPPPEADSCDVTVEAKFLQDGVEERLSHTFHLNVAPMSALDNAFPSSRRPSINGDAAQPRRVMSDSVVPSHPALQSQPQSSQPPPQVGPENQVMQVLAGAYHRAVEEAHTQVATSMATDTNPTIDVLVKQQHILATTATSYQQNVTGQSPDAVSSPVNPALVEAAQRVVYSAARQVAAENDAVAELSMSTGLPAPVTPQITVKEVSYATQSAVAQAVQLYPASSEVDTLHAAGSILEATTKELKSEPR